MCFTQYLDTVMKATAMSSHSLVSITSLLFLCARCFGAENVVMETITHQWKLLGMNGVSYKIVEDNTNVLSLKLVHDHF
jgi:hypothetical protein